MGKTALVTGSAGFVGRNLTARLQRDGWDVTGVDITLGSDCRDVFKYDTGRFDLIVHLAAIVGGRVTIEQEPLQVATDLAIDSDFFQYVMRTRPARAVYFSSSAAYPIRLQQHHDHRLKEYDLDPDRLEEPDAIYGWVKLTGERLAQLANAEGAHVYVFRPFSGYGWDQDLDYPFPSFAMRAKQHQDPFTVWGPGTQVRDWVHISDVCDHVIQALDWDAAVLGPQNICTGIGTDFITLAKKFMDAAGYAGEIATYPEMPAGVMHRVGDPTVSHKIYKPVVTLDEGIDRAVNGPKS